MNQIFKLFCLFIILTVMGCSEAKQADLIVHNAKIYTVNDLLILRRLWL